jgi:hypothetical protein
MMMLAAVLAVCSAAPPCDLRFDPKTFFLRAVMGGREAEILRGVSYSARFTETDPAFNTTGVASVTPHDDGSSLIAFSLDGPAAAKARVECTARMVSPQCLRLAWHIAYTGAERPFFGWSDGLRFAAEKPLSAHTRPLVRWVAPDGKRPYEVAGDTPYPDRDRQLRFVLFADAALAVLTDAYDPDWFYSRDLGRVLFHRLSLPAKAPQESTTTMELVVLRGGADSMRADEDLLAMAHAEPVGVALTTGRAGNIFVPDEPLSLTARLGNATSAAQTCRMTWELRDYHARIVAHGDEQVGLAPWASRDLPLVAPPRAARRGIYFLAGRLRWQGGERLLRTTLSCLPLRAEPKPDERSPFGLAAAICNPDVYPDQPDSVAVLDLAARIGVHWLRGSGFPIREDVKPDEVAAARDRLALLNRYGLTPHIQCGLDVPRTDEQSQAFRRAFAASLSAYKFLSRYVEVGNELNYSTKPDDYVRLVLRPQAEVMRQVLPGGRIMNAGLGGVTKDWWQGFVDAGGLDLVDVVSVHPGHHPRAPEFWEGWEGWVFRPQMLHVFDDLAKRAYRAAKEVWITEAYSPSAPPPSQLDVRSAADYMVREYCVALALGVRVVEWYQFQDGTWYSAAPQPDDIEHNFGMLYTDLTPKPQYVAFGAMTEQLEGATCLGRLDLGADDLYGLRFRRADDRIVDVLWSYREKNECDLPWWPPENYKGKHRLPAEPWEERWKAPVSIDLPMAGRDVQVTDIMGNTQTQTLTAPAGRTTLALTGSPVFIRGLGQIPVRSSLWP